MISFISYTFALAKNEGFMNEIYVVPFLGNWAVKMNGREAPIYTHNVKDDAIRVATQLSKRHNYCVVIRETDDEVNPEKQ